MMNISDYGRTGKPTLRGRLHRHGRAFLTPWSSQDWLLSRRRVWISMVVFCTLFWGAAIGLIFWIS